MADDIDITITEEAITATLTGGDTWDGISGKPTPVAENSFMVSSSALAWVVKTLAQVKTILGLGSIATYNIWTGTQVAYDALGTYSDTTLYFITS